MKQTTKQFNFTVSYNKKRKGKNGTCYTQTVKMPYELKAPLLQYLEEAVARDSMDYMEKFYVKAFIEKLRNDETEEDGWYSPSLTPMRYVDFFLIREAREGRVAGKRDISWRHNTALFFI